MSLSEDLSKSSKISFNIAATLQQLGDVPADKKVLTVIFKTNSSIAEPIDGVKIRADIGTIYTADVSLNGLQKLADDKRVISIQGGQPLSPS